MSATAGRQIVSREKWLEARKALLEKEKEFTRQRDEVSRLRRELPWVKVGKNYIFEGAGGNETLAQLFAGRDQLIVYHFMFSPDWTEGCKSCSFLADHVDGLVIHLAQRNISVAMASRAPLAQIEAFKKRMGWQFKWVSSNACDFNYDYGVSFTKEGLAKSGPNYNFDTQRFAGEEAPGLSVFFKSGDEVFHTYSTYARGLDILIGAYNFIDLTPNGRNETAPNTMAWVRHHDRYSDGKLVGLG